MFLEIMLSAFVLGKEYIKEKTTPVIPAGYWNNKELIYKDRVERHISTEEFMRNLHNGKYYLPEPSDVTKAKAVTKEPEREPIRETKTVYILRQSPHDEHFRGRKQYHEFLPFGKTLYKAYDKDWDKWIIVGENNTGIPDCDFIYLNDKW